MPHPIRRLLAGIALVDHDVLEPRPVSQRQRAAQPGHPAADDPNPHPPRPPLLAQQSLPPPPGEAPAVPRERDSRGEMDNPYDWTRRHTPHFVGRDVLIEEVAASLQRGEGVVLSGGRGMGKSTALQHLAARLEAPDVHVVLFREPPMDTSAAGCLADLAGRLGVGGAAHSSARGVLDAYQQRRDRRATRVVLIYDEIEDYLSGRGEGKRWLDHLELVRQSRTDLAVLVAGGAGTWLLGTGLSSPFVSRALRVGLRPLRRPDLRQLAAPFAARGAALGEDVLDAILLHSGGNPALACYGFQRLWADAQADVSALYSRFQQQHSGFIADARRVLTGDGATAIPLRVLALARSHDGAIPRSALEAACTPRPGESLLAPEEALELLATTGRIELSGNAQTNPVRARPIPSLLDLPRGSDTGAPDLQSQLFADLSALLRWIHASAPDYFRAQRGGRAQIVTESVFAGALLVGLSALGWSVEREVQRKAGRTDLLARHPQHRGDALVEVKIWGRNDYKEIHQQVLSYWTSAVRAGAAVTLTDRQVTADDYAQACLAGLSATSLDAPDLLGAWGVTGETTEGDAASVSHLLLRLARRD